MPASTSAASNAEFQSAARALKAAAHPARLTILCVLGTQELSVGEIEAATGIPQNALSKHLAVLRNKRLLACRKLGSRVLYRSSDDRILAVLIGLCDVICGSGRSRRRA